MKYGPPGMTSAQRQKKYREKCKAEGRVAPRGKSKNRGRSGKSKWDAAEFIALDGEGESYGDVETFTVPNGGKTYDARPHRYTLLAASTGESLFNGGQALQGMACLDFLLNLSDEHPKANFVIFAGSYDINHIFMYGFEKTALIAISRGETYSFKTQDNVEYQIEYRARKSLTLRRGLSFYQSDVTDKKTGEKKKVWKSKWNSKIIIWDVFGFFQENFVAVIAKWLGKTHRHFELIKKMKMLRGDFEKVSQSDINAYNAAELETLVELMQVVRSAIDGLELKVNRWDGAGAIAAALMRKHEIKKFKRDTRDDLIEPVATAYAGGRIEICKIGHYNGTVYDYDINSAYPSVMQNLPCLACGCWVEGTGEPPPGFTLVHCKYKFDDDLPFYPLFYRTRAMQICFASTGEGIYWMPEYEAALKCPGNIDVIKWWHYKTPCNHLPFHWIEHYYKTRQAWIKNPTADWQSGAEKIIKLGLNSLYGKSAQQLGGKSDKPPAYHQLEWAGYITSATRARLFTAGMLDPDAVIGFATDGIFTTRPLPYHHSAEKTMGEWDVKDFAGLTLAMAGVYWWHNKEHNNHGTPRFSHFSRGFDKESMETPAPVLDAWKRGDAILPVKMQRLIGMGSACASPTFWQMRGRFTTGIRNLSLTGQSYKRGACDVKKLKPHLHLVNTKAAFNIRYENQMQGCSYPYPLEWQRNEDFEKELEEEAENADTDNI